VVSDYPLYCTEDVDQRGCEGCECCISVKVFIVLDDLKASKVNKKAFLVVLSEYGTSVVGLDGLLVSR